MLYRVWLPPDAPEEDLPLPGGQPTLTGFWTPHPECAAAIYAARCRAAWEQYGAHRTWARVVAAPPEALVISPPPPGAKTGDNPDYDRDEIFVCDVLHPEMVEDVTEEINAWLGVII